MYLSEFCINVRRIYPDESLVTRVNKSLDYFIKSKLSCFDLIVTLGKVAILKYFQFSKDDQTGEYNTPLTIKVCVFCATVSLILLSNFWNGRTK